MSLNQKLITDYFTKVQISDLINKSVVYPPVDKIYGYKESTNSWHCIQCGVDMGAMNPRQLCGKTTCLAF